MNSRPLNLPFHSHSDLTFYFFINAFSLDHHFRSVFPSSSPAGLLFTFLAFCSLNCDSYLYLPITDAAVEKITSVVSLYSHPEKECDSSTGEHCSHARQLDKYSRDDPSYDQLL